MSDTKWKNLGGKMEKKEGFTNKPVDESPPAIQFPANYPISESSSNNDTIQRIKKIKKRQENPKKIPILENVYESEGAGSLPISSSPENIFTSFFGHYPPGTQENNNRDLIMQKGKELEYSRRAGGGKGSGIREADSDDRGVPPSFFESPQPVKEGLTLPGNLRSNAPGSDKSASDKINSFVEKENSILSRNLTLSQKAYSDKMTATQVEIDKLKHNIFNIDKMSTDFSEDINANPPPSSPMDETLMKQENQNVTKEISQSLKRIGYVIKLMIDKLIKWTKLRIAKFQIQMYKLVLKFNTVVTSIARALTGYEIQPDGSKKYRATGTEIKTFSHEVVRFITVLMSWVFLYNWYYLMFFLNPAQQFKLKLDTWYTNRSTMYAVLGPPLRAVENIDWFMLEFLPRIRYLIPSNGILFFIMSIIFILLVQKGKQWTIMTDFFNAINKSYTTSILSAFVIVCIVFYGLSFAGHFASMFNFALLKTWYTALLWIIITVIYLLCIITLGVPIGMLAVCGFFFFYSFFAIMLYNGFSISPVLNAISEQITNISSVNFDTSNMTWGQWAYTTLQKFVKYFLYFMFEIFLIYILINGLIVYIKDYTIPLSEKATLQNAFSSSGAFKEAFRHLYTWLIIINVLLIVLIGVIMKLRYDNIKNMAPNQPFNTNTGESMLQKLMNIGSITKNAVLNTYNQAKGVKGAISQNTPLGKMRLPFSGKAGVPGVGATSKAGVPSTGSMINAAGSLDSKTLGTIASSATSAARVAAKDPNLLQAGISMASGKGLDIDAISKADPKNLQKVLNSGVNAVGALEKDPASVKAAAGLLGADPKALGKVASAVAP